MMNRNKGKEEFYECSLFIFRRDLRLEDNLGLIAALQHSKTVLPCFILDPRQYKNNVYKSDKAIQFMLESLLDLQQQLAQQKSHLYLFDGKTDQVLEILCKTVKPNAIFINRDYTPFSLQRDQKIKMFCQKNAISLNVFDDALLNPPELTLKKDGTPYKVFTGYYKNSIHFTIPKPVKNNLTNYYRAKLSCEMHADFFSQILPKTKLNKSVIGGRQAGLKKLQLLSKLTKYQQDRDYPSKAATSDLSAHLKFTTVSIREVYHAVVKNLGNKSPLLRQLYWRDFFTSIAFNFPHVFGHSYQKKFERLTWDNNQRFFKAWCEGKTGFPIVDAGMRELNQTGKMHNRVRLICASFLVKDLQIDWQWGEKYFAQKLQDYDPAVNNGNWQWVAGTGTDAQPYFRIFNPWLQQRKFDADCLYIKKWLPELQSLNPKIIHRWDKFALQSSEIDYPQPIVAHALQVKKTKQMYLMK